MTKTWPFCEFRADGSLVICNYGEHGEMQTLYIRTEEIDTVASWLVAARDHRSLLRPTTADYLVARALLEKADPR